MINMAEVVNLAKAPAQVDIMRGGKVNLEKDNPSIKVPNPRMTLGKVGVAWEISKKEGEKFDLDFAMIPIDESGNGIDFIFYKHMKNFNGSIWVLRDEQTGATEGYDEQGFVQFRDVPENVKSIVCVVAIFKYKSRKQNFGQVTNAICDVINGVTGEKIIHYDLTEDMSMANAVNIGVFRRESDDTWAFKALGEASNNGMKGILESYGIIVENDGDE
jgi:tellurium resistance protein TerD